jgi:hypothetical protein
VAPSEERRHPLLNARRSCSAKSALMRQAGSPPPPMGMRERFQKQIPLDVSQGRADQPLNETATRRRGNRSVRPHASHCATPIHNAHRARHQGTIGKLVISYRAPKESRNCQNADPLGFHAATRLVLPAFDGPSSTAYSFKARRGHSLRSVLFRTAR